MNKDMNDLYREGINIRELADKAEPYQPKEHEVETAETPTRRPTTTAPRPRPTAWAPPWSGRSRFRAA